ncbi:MAG: HNH endonuclease [Eubacteriales bacterium]
MSVIIFISERQKIFQVEIPEFESAITFSTTLHKNFVIPEHIAPLAIKEEGKNEIKQYIQSLPYFKTNKVLNRVINFFERISEDEFFFLVLSDKIFSEPSIEYEYFSLMQESLVYYNLGESEESVTEIMRERISEFQENLDYVSSLLYHFDRLSHPTKKTFMGESNKVKRKCIYCKGTQGDTETTFISEAHAIPHSLGNKLLFQNEECDGCNDFFSKEMEEDLSTFFLQERLAFGISSKQGLPSFQFGECLLRYITLEEFGSGKGLGKFESLRSTIKVDDFKEGIALYSPTGEFHNIYNSPYVPVRVYKALVKSVIGTISQRELINLQETIDWLMDVNDYRIMANILKYQNRVIVKEPQLYTFILKEEHDSLPHYYGDFRLGRTILIFPIPFAKQDKKRFSKTTDYSDFEKYMSDFMQHKFEILDFSSVEPVKLTLSLSNDEFTHFCTD